MRTIRGLTLALLALLALTGGGGAGAASAGAAQPTAGPATPARSAGGAQPTAGAAPLAGAAGGAQPAADADPADALEALFAARRRADAPGCAAGALRAGAFVFRGAFGMADIDRRVPLTADSVFRTASLSKQFTAAAVLLAEEQGLLSLDDPLRRHFPDLPAWAEPVRVRHLVHHTSGIRDYLILMALRGTEAPPHYGDADLLAALGRLERLHFAPGREFLYSNTGYWLLGQLIGRVSGRTLREFAAEHLLEPLGMASSRFHDRRAEPVPGAAIGYRPLLGGAWEVHETTLELVGDGGLYASVNDLGRWERMLRSAAAPGRRAVDRTRRRPRIQSPPWSGLARRLLTPGRLDDGAPLRYAGGLRLGDYRGLATHAHHGTFMGWRAQALRFPEPELAVFVLCNSSDARPDALARQIADRLLAAEPEPPLAASDAEPAAELATPPAAELATLTAEPAADPAAAASIPPGLFWESASGSRAEIEQFGFGADRRLELLQDGLRAPLTEVEGALAATLDGARVRLEPRPDGFVLRRPGQRDFRYVQVNPYRGAPPLSAMAELAGHFRSRELDVAWEVRADARAGLTLAWPGGEAALEPVLFDPQESAWPVFAWHSGTLRFLPDADADGPPRAFTIAVQRERGFVFVREGR